MQLSRPRVLPQSIIGMQGVLEGLFIQKYFLYTLAPAHRQHDLSGSNKASAKLAQGCWANCKADLSALREPIRQQSDCAVTTTGCLPRPACFSAGLGYQRFAMPFSWIKVKLYSFHSFWLSEKDKRYIVGIIWWLINTTLVHHWTITANVLTGRDARK
jgi:hypothetical protein